MIGMLIYEMFYNTTPFKGDTPTQLFKSILSDKVNQENRDDTPENPFSSLLIDLKWSFQPHIQSSELMAGQIQIVMLDFALDQFTMDNVHAKLSLSDEISALESNLFTNWEKFHSKTFPKHLFSFNRLKWTIIGVLIQRKMFRKIILMPWLLLNSH